MTRVALIGIFLYLNIILSIPLYAKDVIFKETLISAGMTSISYQEQEKGIAGVNVTEPAAGAISAISGRLEQQIYGDMGRSAYLSASFPLIESVDGNYFQFGAGAKFFFGDNIANQYLLHNESSSIKLRPTFSYYWGVEIAAGYLVYNTIEKKRSDTLLEIGPNAGIYYDVAGIRFNAMVGYGRGVGVLTTASILRINLGMSIFL